MSSSPRTATFLFTDLENSTPLWEKHPDLMQELAARHDALIREAIEAHRGRVVKTTGDGFHAVFDAATDSVAAAIAGQQAMIGESWPAETGLLKVRMGLHTGESREREGDYYGPELNRAARVMGVAHGGQILVSEATAVLIRKALPTDVSLSDLGPHRLKGIAAAEQILELVAEGLTNREIGERLHLAEKTIKHYMTNVLQKLHVRSRVQAALLAQERGLGDRRKHGS